MKRTEFLKFIDDCMYLVESDQIEYSCVAMSKVNEKITGIYVIDDLIVRKVYSEMFEVDDSTCFRRKDPYYPDYIKLRLIALELFKRVMLDTKEYKNF